MINKPFKLIIRAFGSRLNIFYQTKTHSRINFKKNRVKCYHHMIALLYSDRTASKFKKVTQDKCEDHRLMFSCFFKINQNFAKNDKIKAYLEDTFCMCRVIFQLCKSSLS